MQKIERISHAVWCVALMVWVFAPKNTEWADVLLGVATGWTLFLPSLYSAPSAGREHAPE